MKMKETAPKILKQIKISRKITAIELSKKLEVPIRRIYDVTAILEALDLIDIIKPPFGKTKIFSWRGTKAHGKTVTFNTNKIKIETDGAITSITNNGTCAVLTATRQLRVENYVDYLNR